MSEPVACTFQPLFSCPSLNMVEKLAKVLWEGQLGALLVCTEVFMHSWHSPHVYQDLCAFVTCSELYFLIKKRLRLLMRVLVQKAGKPCSAWEDLGPCYVAAGKFRNWVKDGRFMGGSTAAAQLLKLGGGTPRFWFMLKDILSIFYPVIILWKKKCINCPDC